MQKEEIEGQGYNRGTGLRTEKRTRLGTDEGKRLGIEQRG